MRIFFCFGSPQITGVMADADRSLKNPSSTPEKEDVKSPNLLGRAKEEIESTFHAEKSPRHHKETHGTSNDIDESTPVDEVKGPSLFERVKEEIEALAEAVHPKK